MTIDDYRLYILKTVEEYSARNQKHIHDLFTRAGILTNESQITMGSTPHTIVMEDNSNILEQISTCIKKCDEAILILEKWEFEKDYKYSTIFEADNFDGLLLNTDSCDKFADCKKDESSMMFATFEKPLAYDDDSLRILKFNLKYEVANPATGVELFVKYPVLAVIHKKDRLVEFRFDSLNKLFISDKNNRTIFSDIISGLKDYISREYKTKLLPVDLEFLVELTKDNTDGCVCTAQHRKLHSGGNAILEVGKSQDYVLPIIGELKELIKDNSSELENVPSLKEALENFIYENDELSDYSWIVLLWLNEKSTRNFSVKITFQYRALEFNLLQHHSNPVLVGMRRMNDVIRYISDHRKVT